ncbi:MAG: hypothetical protein ACO34J_00005, partial [Prochlorothrix sp.]
TALQLSAQNHPRRRKLEFPPLGRKFAIVLIWDRRFAIGLSSIPLGSPICDRPHLGSPICNRPLFYPPRIANLRSPFLGSPICNRPLFYPPRIANFQSSFLGSPICNRPLLYPPGIADLQSASSPLGQNQGNHGGIAPT